MPWEGLSQGPCRPGSRRCPCAPWPRPASEPACPRLQGPPCGEGLAVPKERFGLCSLSPAWGVSVALGALGHAGWSTLTARWGRGLRAAPLGALGTKVSHVNVSHPHATAGRLGELRSRSYGSWVRAPRQAPGRRLGAPRLLQILCLPLSLPLPCSCSLSSLKTRRPKEKKKKKPNSLDIEAPWFAPRRQCRCGERPWGKDARALSLASPTTAPPYAALPVADFNLCPPLSPV